jgi:hypothetical protein
VASQWWYTSGDVRKGPVSSEQLKGLAASGELSPSDLVWKESLQGWTPARKVKDLFPLQVPPPLPQCGKNQPVSFSSQPPVAQKPRMTSNANLIAGLHRQRFVVAVAASAGMLATFLPWVHAPIVGTIMGTAGDGWITLALFIPAAVLALRGVKDQPLEGGYRLGAAIPAGIAAMIGIVKLGDIIARKNDLPQDNPLAKAISASVQIGFGLYLLIAAGIALVVFSEVLAKPSSRDPTFYGGTGDKRRG